MFHKVTFWMASIMYVFFNERVTKLDIMRHIFKVNLFHLYLSFLAMLYGYMSCLHGCVMLAVGFLLVMFYCSFFPFEEQIVVVHTHKALWRPEHSNYM